jgi:hypothetical protein
MPGCPPLLTWHIFSNDCGLSFHVVSACVLNQFNSQSLLFDACLPLSCAWNVVKKLQTHMVDDDFKIAFELFLFATNIKKEICDVLESFFLFKNMKTKSLATCYF